MLRAPSSDFSELFSVCTLCSENNKEGWQNGICIEGNSKYWYGLAAHRNCTVIGAFVGGTSDGVQMDVKMSIGVFGGIVGFDNKANSGKKRGALSP